MKQKLQHTVAFNLEVGQRISDLRSRLGYNQEAFAKLIGITRGKLSQIEIGRTAINLIDLKSIVTKCSTTYDYVIEGKESDLSIAAEPTSVKYKTAKVKEISQEDYDKLMEIANSIPYLVKQGTLKIKKP